MPIEAATPGQVFVEPGFFYSQSNVGGIAQGATQNGIVAAVIAANDGPINTPQLFTTEAGSAAIFGPGGTYGSVGGTGMVRQMWRETPSQVVIVRVGGTGGSAGSVTFSLTGGVTPAVVLPFAWAGTGPNAWTFTIRNSSDNTVRQLIAYAGDGSVLATFTFPIAPTTVGGRGEPGALLAAINAAASPYFGTATFSGAPPADNSTLANVVNGIPAQVPGVNPTTAAADYATAINTLSTTNLNAIATDSVSQVVAASLQSFVDSQRNYGRFLIGVTGEPIGVSRATRLTDAKAFNDPAFGYFGNGYTDAYGNHDGADAAGRFAAAYAAQPLAVGFTNYVIKGATAIRDPFNLPDFRTAILSGEMIFSLNDTGQVVIGYGNTTFLTPNTNFDAGWKKWRRVKIRDSFVGQVAAAIAPLSGQFGNNPATRATIVMAAQRVINSFLQQGLFVQPSTAQLALITQVNPAQINTAFEDPNQLPSGDSAHFVALGFDADTLDKIYMAFGWQY